MFEKNGKRTFIIINIIDKDCMNFETTVDQKLNKMDIEGVEEYRIGVYECLVEFLTYYKQQVS